MLLILTLVSTTLAIVMTVVAWRAMSEQRRRSEARVAALAAEIRGGLSLDDLMLRDERAATAFALHDERSAEASALQERERTEREPLGERNSAPEMFATAQQPTAGSRYGVALAAAAFVLASIAAVGIVFGGGSETSATAQSRPPEAVATDGRSVPLELVALSHERVENTLTVRGIVRNPADGSPMDRLTAVVYLFAADGGFLASGRAAVESPSLIPAGESTFVVSVPVTSDVARYRVSFRSGDRIIAHLDKRHRF